MGETLAIFFNFYFYQNFLKLWTGDLFEGEQGSIKGGFKFCGGEAKLKNTKYNRDFQ